MAMTWEQTKAAAMNILGKTAKIPEPKANLAKMAADLNKTWAEYDKAVDLLQAKILAAQNQCSTAKNTVKQYQDMISKNYFGLDKTDDGVGAKVDKARDLLDTYLDTQMSICETNIKNLDELDKHTMAISNYKPAG